MRLLHPNESRNLWRVALLQNLDVCCWSLRYSPPSRRVWNEHGLFLGVPPSTVSFYLNLFSLTRGSSSLTGSEVMWSPSPFSPLPPFTAKRCHFQQDSSDWSNLLDYYYYYDDFVYFLSVYYLKFDCRGKPAIWVTDYSEQICSLRSALSPDFSPWFVFFSPLPFLSESLTEVDVL